MTTTEFINKIAPIVQKYAPQYNIKVCSPIIAQAILESGWGKSSLASVYNNYFGLKCGGSWKGKSVNMATKEEYTPGTITNITANFRVYDSLDEGIKGYFDFINYDRYANLKGVTDPMKYIELIKADGYATSSNYIDSLKTLVKEYNLTRFDTTPTTSTTTVNTNKETTKMDGKKMIKGIQSFLNAMGFDCGTVDGIVGPKTINAMTNYLKSL